MDVPTHPEPPLESLNTQDKPESDPLIERTSAEYLGRWNRLVSMTNWEKGRIICQWRAALIAADVPGASYSDREWSRRVGNVTARHVCRLRKVYDRFGRLQQDYPGLYWSHFQAALEWPDAEMWLEGAAQSGWSVAQMRNRRGEALGAPPEKKPSAKEVLAGRLDAAAVRADQAPVPEMISGSLAEVQPAEPTGGQRAQSDAGRARRRAAPEPGGSAPQQQPGAVEPFRPFEDLPDLPPDLGRAFKALRQAVLRYKVGAWQRVSPEQVLAALDTLKELVLAPAEE